MRGFIIGTVVTAVAFYILVTLLPAMFAYDGEITGLIVISVIFGIVNGLIGPIVQAARAADQARDAGPRRLPHQRRAAAPDRVAVRPRRLHAARRRFPAGPADHRHARRGRRRGRRPVPHLVRHPACRQGLSRASRSRCAAPPDATARRSSSPTSRRSTSRARRCATPFRTRSSGTTRSRRMTCRRSSRRSRRAGSARTSSRAASGRWRVARACRTTGSRSRASARPRPTCATSARAAANDEPLRVGGDRVARGGRGARPRRPARQEVRVPPRRPVPAEPGRRPRDPCRPRRRLGCRQVRHDRDRDRGGHRGRRRPGRSAPCRAASTCTSARSWGPWMHGGTPSARRSPWPRCGAGRSTRSTPSISAAASRSCPLDQPSPSPERFARELPALARQRPRRPATEPPRDRARAGARGAGRLVGRARPARARSRRSAGRPRCRHDRADPPGAVRGAAPDRGPHLARPRPCRPGLPSVARRAPPTPPVPGSNPRASRARSANRPIRSASTTCRHSAAATSWRSPTPARTRRPWVPRTTAGRGPPQILRAPDGTLTVGRRRGTIAALG